MQNAEFETPKGMKAMGKETDLRNRTKQFALRVIKVADAMPRRLSAEVIGKQVLRSGTSVGAHYREACRARSRAEFISKMEVGLQELDETTYWFELITESGMVPADRLVPLHKEGGELTAIFAASINTAKKRR
jgi:four helix bundle protein